MNNVSVVILNYNNSFDTIECLKSIFLNTYKAFNVIIVDNYSTDNSIKNIENYLKKNLKPYSKTNSHKQNIKNLFKKNLVTIIENDFNGGYAYGNNIGIKFALSKSADFVLIINNDTIVEKNFLTKLIQRYNSETNVGIVGSKIKFFSKKNLIWFNGGEFSRILSEVSHIDINKKDIGQVNSTDNGFISGCVWLIPSFIFSKIGLIDEDYFMYVEDLDYCYRVKNHGFKLLVASESIVYHKEEDDPRKYSNLKIYKSAQNSVLFLKKHYKLNQRIIPMINLLFIKPFKMILRGFFKNSFLHLKGTIRGIYS